MHAKFGCDPTAVSKKVPFNFISRFTVNTACLGYEHNMTNTSIYRMVVAWHLPLPATPVKVLSIAG